MYHDKNVNENASNNFVWDPTVDDFEKSPGNKMSDNTVQETICDEEQSKIMDDVVEQEVPDTINMDIKPFNEITMFEIVNRAMND